jgi:MFS family permease
MTSTTLRALRHRNFQLFFAGQLISLIGTWMQNVAQSWLVYRITGSSALLGLVSFAGQIPVFALSPIGGYTADRWPKRTVVIVTQTVSMLLAGILALLTLTGNMRIWEIFVLASLLGVVNAFDIPARQSFFVEMVGREDLINAIALNSSMFNGARIAGPAIAGILVAKIGEGWCFAANSASYIAVIIGLILMRLTTPTAKRARASAFETIREGFHYVGRTMPVLSFLLLVGVLSLAGLPYLVLMPIYADRVFHTGASGLGLLMGITGLGALAGALTLASRTALTGLTRWAGISMVIFGLSLAGFAFSTNIWLSSALLLITGFTGMIQMGASNTLIQSMVPDALRGRVMSVYSMMYMGLGPMGAMFAGFAADQIGAQRTLFIGAVFCLVASVVFIWRREAIRSGAAALIQTRRAAANG